MQRRMFLLATTFAALAGSVAVYWPRRWRHIVIHHSAGNYGTIEFLQQVHRDRQGIDPIDAIPYHYVIGNGNGLGMGEVASDWRQEWDLWGTHVSGNNKSRNVFGLGVCLIGNFEDTDVPTAQYESLLSLTRSLMQQYDIPPDNVSFHGKIDGESTKCPGTRFPYEAFNRAISEVRT